MNEFPSDISESSWNEKQRNWDEGNTESIVKKTAEYRQRIAEQFLKLKESEKEFVFMFENNVPKPVRDTILKELFERFPDKKFQYGV